MTAKQIKVMQAYQKGCKIESKSRIFKGWKVDPYPKWDWDVRKYRIAKCQHTELQRWLYQHEDFITIVDVTDINAYTKQFGGTPIKHLGDYQVYRG